MHYFQQILIVFIGLSMTLSSHGSTIQLKDMAGQPIAFESLRGKWVFINYWASWCQPCLDEISELNRFYRQKNAEIALFAVNYDMLPVENQRALIKKYNIHYPSLQTDPANALKLGDIRGVPATFVFNPEGKLSATLYGRQTLRSLNQAILRP